MDLTTLLVSCGSNDNVLRKNAEEQVKVLRRNDPAGFIYLLGQELADESKPEQARFLGSILFKNTILSNDPQFKNLWVSLPIETKEQIKKHVLGTLASPYKNARKGAAQAVSAIAGIELQRGEWAKIIDILAANAHGDTLEYKLASLETLGYICEELPDGTLSVPQVDTVLSALVTNVMPHIPSEDVKLAALSALSFCIRFCDKNFRVDTEKNTIVENILANCNSPNSEIRMKAMQCILEIARCFYDFIGGKTLENIGLTTFNDIRVDDTEEVALMALEVWCSICDEEIERLKKGDPNRPCRDYIRTAYSGLMMLLLESLKRKSANDENDWNISVASACCLSLIAVIVKDPIADHVLNYISENIGSPDWKSRDAALLSFASILKGPQKATMNHIISQAIDTLLALLRDAKHQVRETTAWTFAKIAEHNSEPLLDPSALPKVVTALITSLKDKPKISNQVCFSLHNLAEAARPDEASNSGSLSLYFKNILEALWGNAFRPDAFEEAVNLANSSFAAFSNVIQNSAPDVQPNLMHILQMLVEEFAMTMQPTYRAASKAMEYQGYLCSAMQPALIKLTEKITPPITAHIVDLILESFKMRKAVYDEGILALSGLITTVGRDFQVHMEKFGPYLVYALKNVEDTTLCRVSVGCVGDIARALEELMANYLGEIMPIFMDILRNPETDRGVKLNIITVLSDLAMATSKFFMPYLKEVLEILKSAADLTLHPPSEDDPDLPNYIASLKEAIIEGYTGVVYGLKIAQDTTVMDPYITDIFRYMEALCSGELNMEMDFLKSIVGLIGDFADLYEGRIKELVNQPFVHRVIGVMDKATNKEYKGVAAWAKTSISKANNK